MYMSNLKNKTNNQAQQNINSHREIAVIYQRRRNGERKEIVE